MRIRQIPLTLIVRYWDKNAIFVGETSFEKFPPHPFQELAHNRHLNNFVSLHTDSRRASQGRALAVASAWVAKRRGGNKKHHSVVFEPHRDRAAARPTKTPRCLSKPQAWHIIPARSAVHIIKGRRAVFEIFFICKLYNHLAFSAIQWPLNAM